MMNILHAKFDTVSSYRSQGTHITKNIFKTIVMFPIEPYIHIRVAKLTGKPRELEKVREFHKID